MLPASLADGIPHLQVAEPQIFTSLKARESGVCV